MIIILHVNDRVESKFSKLSSKVSKFETFENFKILQLLSLRRTSSKQNLFWNNSQNEAILISNDLLFLSYTCLDKNVSKMCLPIIEHNTIKVSYLRFKYIDVFLMYFHSRCIEYKNFVQNILIALLSLVNVFTYTEKGQRYGEILKTIKFSLYTCT